MAAERSPKAASKQADNCTGKQIGADRVERPAQREDLRRAASRSDGGLKPTRVRDRESCMERIDERIQSLVTQMVARQPVR